MAEPKEVTIKIKGEDKTSTFKHLIYDEMTCSSEDDVLKPLIDQATKEFMGEIDTMTITIRLTM